jgi:hypothetical protein
MGVAYVIRARFQLWNVMLCLEKNHGSKVGGPTEYKTDTPFGASVFCSSTWTRTRNPPVTRGPAFPQGVDYLIIPEGCRALWDVSDGLLIPSLCTFPATHGRTVALRRTWLRIAATRSAAVSLNSPDCHLPVAGQRC